MSAQLLRVYVFPTYLVLHPPHAQFEKETEYAYCFLMRRNIVPTSRLLLFASFFSPGSIIQWYYLYESVDSDLEKNTDHQIGLINGKGNINNNQGTPFDTTWFFHRYI